MIFAYHGVLDMTIKRSPPRGALGRVVARTVLWVGFLFCFMVLGPALAATGENGPAGQEGEAAISTTESAEKATSEVEFPAEVVEEAVLEDAESVGDTARELSRDEILAAIDRAAQDNDLPADLMTRLIRVESGFNRLAVSHKGAQGIAQFMPATAAERGLEDPFDPEPAIEESARYMRDLKREFGNLGLAAAAYNAGPGRVQAWLGGRAGLPAETRRYVRSVTGRSAEEWLTPQQRARLRQQTAASAGADASGESSTPQGRQLQGEALLCHELNQAGGTCMVRSSF